MPTKIQKILLGAAAIVSLTGCRQDMHDQPRYKPLGTTEFFDDKRQSRPVLAGTVARGDLREAADFYTGKAPDAKTDLDYFPITVTKAVIERGQQRFDVFCSPCHGKLGNGQGMIVLRGMKQPPSYHIARLRDAPVGHFYDVITNGYGSMYNYAAQIPPRDRWAIISYIRTLQYSTNVKKETLPSSEAAMLPAPPVPGQMVNPALQIAPSSPDMQNMQNNPLAPGTPATPMSPAAPPKQGAETKGADKK